MYDTSAVSRVLKGSVLYFGLAAVFLTGCLLSKEFLTIGNQRDVLWQVSLNGIPVVDADLNNPVNKEQDHPGLTRTSGYIGFQNHGSRLDYRNIRIRTLN